MLSDAAALEAEADALEARMLDGAEPVNLGKIDQLKQHARNVRFAARAAERRAERETAARRRADLEALAAEVDAFAAAQDDTELIAQLVKVAAEAARFRELIAARNQAVAGLAGRVRSLGCAAPVPAGLPDGVGPGPDGSVLTNTVRVSPYEPHVAAEALAAVVAGRQPRLPAFVAQRVPLARPERLFITVRSLQVTAWDSRPLPGSWPDLIAKREMAELGNADIDAWMAGRLDVPAALARKGTAK